MTIYIPIACFPVWKCQGQYHNAVGIRIGLAGGDTRGKKKKLGWGLNGGNLSQRNGEYSLFTLTSATSEGGVGVLALLPSTLSSPAESLRGS